jgi:hypothetical protein
MPWAAPGNRGSLSWRTVRTDRTIVFRPPVARVCRGLGQSESVQAEPGKAIRHAVNGGPQFGQTD